MGLRFQSKLKREKKQNKFHRNERRDTHTTQNFNAF